MRDAAAGIRDVLEDLTRAGKAACEVVPTLDRVRRLLNRLRALIRSPIRALAATLSTIALAGCAGAPDQVVPVTCASIRPAATPAGAAAPGPQPEGSLTPPLAVGPDDVLELVVVLDSVPDGPGSVRVRVDGLAEPGVIAFFMPPPTAAAAGMALAPPASFTGCAAIAAAGLELHAPAAPRAKAWVRVSSDRPVRVRSRVAGRRTGPLLVIKPGSSGMVSWEGE